MQSECWNIIMGKVNVRCECARIPVLMISVDTLAFVGNRCKRSWSIKGLL
jgi:hypothetical protein